MIQIIAQHPPCMMIQIIAHIYPPWWFKLSHTSTMIQIIIHSHHDSNYLWEPLIGYNFLVSNQHTHTHTVTMIQIIAHSHHTWFKLSHMIQIICIQLYDIGMFLICSCKSALTHPPWFKLSHTTIMIQIRCSNYHTQLRTTMIQIRCSNYHTHPPWFKLSRVLCLISTRHTEVSSWLNW